MAKKLTDDERAQLDALNSRAHLTEDEPDENNGDEPLTPISKKKGKKLLAAFGLDLEDDSPEESESNDEGNPKPDKEPLPKERKQQKKDNEPPPRNRYFG